MFSRGCIIQILSGIRFILSLLVDIGPQFYTVPPSPLPVTFYVTILLKVIKICILQITNFLIADTWIGAGLGCSIGSASNCKSGGCWLDPSRVGNISTVILSHLLIQEGQLSVSGKRMCTILVNRLED